MSTVAQLTDVHTRTATHVLKTFEGDNVAIAIVHLLQFVYYFFFHKNLA